MNKPRQNLLPLIGLLLSVAVSGAARAEWVQLGRTDNFRLYVDQDTLQRRGEAVELWQLMDFVTAQWTDAQTVVGSIRSRVEYDCTQSRSRTLKVEAYSEQMGIGRLVATEQLAEPQWDAIGAGSVPDAIRRQVCGK